MSDPVTVTLDGVEFILCQDYGTSDMWMPTSFSWDGPTDPRPLSEWRTVLAQWAVARQTAAGFKAWDMRHDCPEYWALRDAVFRSGIPTTDPKYRFGTHEVLFRNGNPNDPKSLYGVARGYTAMDTPEVVARIDAAKEAYAELKRASAAWRKARNAIPVMPEDEWLKLALKPEKF